MFKLAKRSAKKLREFALSLLNPILGSGKKPESREAVDPLLIKAQIPRSWFTKKGPGVKAQALKVFEGFTPLQREYALMRGWFPETWRKDKRHQAQLRRILEKAEAERLAREAKA